MCSLIIVSLIVVLGIGLFVLTGCGNKEKSITSEKTESKTTSTETKNDNDLVGTWEGETTGGLKTTFVFENGGTVKYENTYGAESVSTGTYEINNNVVTIKLESWDKEKEYTFDIKDGKLSLTRQEQDHLCPNYIDMIKK